MLKSCKYCGRIHDSKFDCERKPVRKRGIKQSEEIRYTTKMKKKSVEIKEKAKYLCELCWYEGRITTSNLETHHIEKLVDRPDLALEDDNLICLCRRCHEKAENGEVHKYLLKEIVRRRDNPPGI